ncbi:transposase family protein [Streptomyces sp. NPDC006668]|uniref:transposase family protein n=1 Tax=Streptomyces sp. NPDC006668 TaxID=3156903 RepID=UPI003403FBC0
MRWPVPAAPSSPIPPVLVKLSPLDASQVADRMPLLERVPDPRARRGRWYSLTAILLVCACAAVSGMRSVDEIAEWAARASDTALTAAGDLDHRLLQRGAATQRVRLQEPDRLRTRPPSQPHRGAGCIGRSPRSKGIDTGRTVRPSHRWPSMGGHRHREVLRMLRLARVRSWPATGRNEENP